MVEGTALEKRHTGNRIVSSNLTPTATDLVYTRRMANVLDLKRLSAGDPGRGAAPSSAPPTMADAMMDEKPEVPEVAEEPEVIDATPVMAADTDEYADALLASTMLPVAVRWEAQHALVGAARQRHLYLLAGLLVLGALVAWWQASVVVFLVVLAGVAALEVREQWGGPVQVAIHEQGIEVDGRTFAHADFTSFDLHRMPDDTVELSLHTNRWHIPHLRLPLGQQDPGEVHAVLTQYLPQGRHSVPRLDFFIHNPRP